MLYACKGVPGARKLWVCIPVRERERERKKERDIEILRERERWQDRERERDKERKRKMMAALKGMTGALAPFSYLVRQYSTRKKNGTAYLAEY